jgi:hypothetical protein
MVPAVGGETAQVTAVWVVLVTIAVNCWVKPASTCAVVGLTETVIEPDCNVTVALADFVASACDVAVTVAVIWLVTDDGAV